MGVADAAGFPVAIYTTSARPHEVTLVQSTLAQALTQELPQRLIGDKAYDSDPSIHPFNNQGLNQGLNSLPPPNPTGSKLRPKTVAIYVATNAGGRSSGYLLGFRTSVVS